MSTLDTSIIVGALTVIVGLFSLLNSVGASWVSQRAAQRAKSVELYDEYYSPENYRRVVLPVFRVMMKWMHLPQPKREEYGAVLREAWLGFHEDPARKLTMFEGQGWATDDVYAAHFHHTQSSDAFTEHEALTVLLYFWTKVNELLKAGVIDERTAVRLLRKPYSYLSNFIAEFRADIMRNAGSDELPAWCLATQELEKVLKVPGKEQVC